VYKEPGLEGADSTVWLRKVRPPPVADRRALSDTSGMTDLERILPLWRELEAAAADYVLATVVAVEGSSYRKPGACMLLAPDGRRAGTVSGGCLEAQVASRAWWLTAEGPRVQRYSTAEEDGERPYGSGCGGVVHLLLERRSTAGPLLAALEQAFQGRIPLAVATVLEGAQLGRRAFAGLEPETAEKLRPVAGPAGEAALQMLAEAALALPAPPVAAALIDLPHCCNRFDSAAVGAWPDFALLIMACMSGGIEGACAIALRPASRLRISAQTKYQRERIMFASFQKTA